MKLVLRYCLAIGVFCACSSEAMQDSQGSMLQNPEQLPFQRLALEDLSAFQPVADNWQIVGNVYMDYEQKHHVETEEGTTTLVNLPTDDAKENLFTNWEHGDMELKVEVMMPQGSNSGIYFQGRYEIQLFDSWLKEDPKHFDIGGIYQRWDESLPEGEKGFAGHAPHINASKAPGLWQTLHILFRAPRFDAGGNKIQPAKFEWVYLNDILIHEDVILNGPTRAAAYEDEVATGPLMIQGDHGPVAIRNIRYKKYSDSQLELADMNYKIYDYQGDTLPMLDSLELITEGQTDSFNVAELSPQREHFAAHISGKLIVPTTGDYLFQTLLDDGGNLYIDDQLVVYNGGELEFETLGGITHLTEGTHDISLVFFQSTWRAHATIHYEGPEMEKQLLASYIHPSTIRKTDPLYVSPGESPEMIRGFVNYKDEKRTHVLTVGDPSGLHYSYDLTEATPIACWRGPFVDVSEMWINRGLAQLLKPLNTTVTLTSGIPITQLSEAEANWPEGVPETFVAKGYRINATQQPVFEYAYRDIKFIDLIEPLADRLQRTFELSAPSTLEGTYIRLAKGQSIDQLEENLYRVDGAYYLDLQSGTSGAEIKSAGANQALIIPVLQENNTQVITYHILW